MYWCPAKIFFACCQSFPLLDELGWLTCIFYSSHLQLVKNVHQIPKGHLTNLISNSTKKPFMTWKNKLLRIPSQDVTKCRGCRCLKLIISWNIIILKRDQFHCKRQVMMTCQKWFTYFCCGYHFQGSKKTVAMWCHTSPKQTRHLTWPGCTWKQCFFFCELFALPSTLDLRLAILPWHILQAKVQARKMSTYHQ